MVMVETEHSAPIEDEYKARLVRFFDDHAKFVPSALADNMVMMFRPITFKDSKEMFYWKDGVFLPHAEVEIDRMVKANLKEKYTAENSKAVIDHVRALTYIDRKEANSKTNLIACENGLIDQDMLEYDENDKLLFKGSNAKRLGETDDQWMARLCTPSTEPDAILKPFDPNYIIFTKIPVMFHPFIDCPKYKQSVREWLTDEPHIKLNQEWLGYCLYRKHPIHKFLLQIGGGRNGKTTNIHVFENLLGFENIASITLHDLAINRFMKAELVNKLANLSGEVKAKAIYSSDIIRNLTGEDPITFERKYGQPFTAHNTAKLISNCNTPPKIKDATDAMWERLQFQIYPNQFIGKAANLNLKAELTTPEELSGILNYALAGLKRLLKNGVFSVNLTGEETYDQYGPLSNTIDAYAQLYLVVDVKGEAEKPKEFEKYHKYCEGKHIPTESRIEFGRQIPACFLGATITDGHKGKDRIPIWKGIRPKTQDELTKQAASDETTKATEGARDK